MATEDQEQPRRTIAIVDDDAAFRLQLKNVLVDAGYKTIEVADGAGALAAIETEGKDIDLMIVDLCLPDNTSGLDVILAAKRREIPAKIIATTSVMEQLYLDIAHDLGADVAVRKPNEDEVAVWSLQTISQVLHHSIPVTFPSHRLVVLAEDDDNIRRLVKGLLQHTGFQVLEAADGALALELIEKINGAVDLLITDYEMPRLNGAALVRAVRAKYANVPVIYMSGYLANGDGHDLDDPARCCAFIPKPFFPKDFVQLATKMIASKTRDVEAKSD